MIVVDTNIVSEVMRLAPTESVLSWLNEQTTANLYLSTITIAEICFGLRVLPMGARRRLLEDKFERFVALAFEQRILSFGEMEARLYSDLMGHRREIGHPLSMADGQIAAIARVHGYAIATRNIRDFEDCGLELINPFS